MGYETKIYLCLTYAHDTDYHEDTYHEGKLTKWHHQVASVDLCKVGYDTPTAALFKRGREWCKKNNLFPYAEYEGFVHDNGEEDERAVIEDPYGDPLGIHDPVELLEALEAENKNDPYRRFTLAIAMLKAFVSGDFGDPHGKVGEKPVVLSYGH